MSRASRDVRLFDQTLRYGWCVVHIIGYYRESIIDRSCSAGNGLLIQRCEGVDERAETVECILLESCLVSRCDITEDHGGSAGCGYCMGYRRDILSDWEHTYIESSLVSGFFQLLDDAAHQTYKVTLGLVALHQCAGFFYCRSCIDDHGDAGDVSGYQGYTQLTDLSIGHMSQIRCLIGLRAIDVFHGFDQLCGQGGSHTGFEGAVQTAFSFHLAFDISQGFFSLFQVCDLCSGLCIITGQGVSGVRKTYRFVFSIFRNGRVNGFACLCIHGIVSVKYDIK